MQKRSIHTPCDILIPKTKVTHFPIEFARFLNRLNRAFGGWTITGDAYGAWIDSGGQAYDDHSAVVNIAIADEPEAVNALKLIVANAAHGLGEIAIYVRVGDKFAIFVYAQVGSGLYPDDIDGGRAEKNAISPEKRETL